MTKRAIILFAKPLTLYDTNKFQFNLFEQNHLKPVVLDLSVLLSKKKPLHCNLEDRESALKYSIIVRDHEHLSSLLKRYRKCIFIDYVLGLNQRNFATYSLFKQLKKYQIRYYAIDLGPLPVESSLTAKTRKSQRILSKLNFSTILRYLFRKIIRLRSYINDPLQSPYRVFSLNNPLTHDFTTKLKIPCHRIHFINSEDYDHYLNNRSLPPIINDQYITFIDQNIAHCTDAKEISLSEMSPEEYFSSINKLFDYIEAKTSLKVVIAAHPRSHYDNEYMHRPVYKGKTFNLVCHSKYVITHDSTAISYAVLSEKPVIFILTEGILKIQRDFDIYSISGALQQKPINIDSPQEVSHIDFKKIEVDKDIYKDYTRKYLLSDPDIKSSWLCIFDYIIKDTSSLEGP